MSATQVERFNLQRCFGEIDQPWTPHLAARVGDCAVKLARLEGEFVWHAHEQADELFLVVAGKLTIELRDGEVELEAGEMALVPAGVEHRPVAKQECRVLLFEPETTLNTGDAEDPRKLEELPELEPDELLKSD